MTALIVVFLVTVTNLCCCTIAFGPLDLTATTSATNKSQCGSGCRCDPLCAQYGDCCPESEYFVAEEQLKGASQFTCTSISGRDFYIKSKCLPEWTDVEIQSKCERADSIYRDPLLDVPLTSKRTNTAYLNWYCAFCNNDVDEGTLRMWPFRFYCEANWNRNLTTDEALELLHFDSQRQTWVINTTSTNKNKEKNNTCIIVIEAPYQPDFDDRGCISDAVSGCPANWTDESIRADCEAHTKYVCSANISYRNEHCATCNDVIFVHPGGCLSMRATPGEYLPPFSLLLNWQNLEKQGKCNSRTEIYDPLYHSCRKVFYKQATPRNGDWLPNNVSSSSTTRPLKNVKACNISDLDDNLYSEDFISCSRICLEPDTYIVDDSHLAVYVPRYDRNYSEREFVITDDDRLLICIPREFLWTGHDNVWGIITAVGISISVVFLILHLVVHILTPKLHNLSSLNLASLCVALLFLYICFIIVSWTELHTSSCVTIAVVMHYSLLASFSWMLTIAFDIFRVLRQATAKLIVTSGTQLKRYSIYSVWTWLLPAFIIMLAVVAEFCPNTFPEDLQPGYGIGPFCWLGKPHGLLLFCIVPLAFIMIVNVIFFSWSAYLISSAAADTRNSSNSQRDFSLYLRLALLMGFTWIIGLIAGATQVNGLWALFVVLNTLQGLFIFMAFSCTHKVWRELYRHSVKIRSRGQHMNLAVHTPVTGSTNTHSREYRHISTNLAASVFEKG